MHLHLAEAARKGHLVAGWQVLRREEQDLVAQERLVQGVEFGIVEVEGKL